MKENDRIADRIAIAVVLLGLALASAGAGTFGPTAAQPQTGVGQPGGSLVDGTRFDFPINNVTAGVGATLSAFAFPIDNATLVAGAGGSASDLSSARGAVPLAPGQDMDPY
ncbi:MULTISPECIES: hypothetical protein [Halorussus]|uniref:hypothetical protein n=1 Tax=Halorussus TaxID=1070314 RepID=UPI000E212B34|nr:MULTISPECIES: hypothetical protein [Halorussus]NHN60394.1 hypothetical protein [Halorussus sp. JP-T4]